MTIQFYRACILVLMLFSLRVAEAAEETASVTLVPRAHAHNDYYHSRPLLDALDQGFCSVEADVFLVDGRLLVGHWRNELRPERTLQRLYLDPLFERVKTNGGAVHPGGGEFTLLVDIKEDGQKTYETLREVLQDYNDMLTSVKDGRLQRRAVRIILSGNRPIAVVAARRSRRVALDGRMPDLDSNKPAHLFPLISDSWRNHFTWRGRGTMPEDQRSKLAQMVAQAHRAGRRLRFWAIPDRPDAWQTLYDAGVDLINTDNLEGLGKFLRDRPRE